MYILFVLIFKGGDTFMSNQGLRVKTSYRIIGGDYSA